MKHFIPETSTEELKLKTDLAVVEGEKITLTGFGKHNGTWLVTSVKNLPKHDGYGGVEFTARRYTSEVKK